MSGYFANYGELNPLSVTNEAVKALGEGINRNRIPLTQASQVATAIGTHGDPVRRANAITALLNAGYRGEAEQKGIAPALSVPATPQQAVTTPTQSTASQAPVGKTKLTIEDSNGDGIPDILQRLIGRGNSAGSTAGVPAALAAGPQPIQRATSIVPNFQTGTGGSNVAASVPAPIDATVQPSVQNLNVAAPALSEKDFSNYGWAGGNTMDLARVIATNRLAQTGHDIEAGKLGPATTQANAALIKANTDASEYGLEERGFQTEQELKKAQTGEILAKIDDYISKKRSINQYDPLNIGKVEQAKKEAELAVEKGRLVEFLASPLSATLIPSNVAQAAGLSPRIRTYGDAAKMYGPKDAMDKLTDAYTKVSTAQITSKGVVDSQTMAAMVALKDIQQKEVAQNMAAINELTKKANTLLMNPEEKKANQIRIDFYKELYDAGLKKLSQTEADFVKLATGGKMVVGSDRRGDVEVAKDGTQYTDKPIVVKGMEVPANSDYRINNGKVQFKPRLKVPVVAPTSTSAPTKVEPTSLIRPEGLSPRLWIKMTPIERSAAIEASRSKKRTAYYGG